MSFTLEMWGFVLVGLFIITGMMLAFSIIPPISVPHGFGIILAFQAVIGLVMLFGPIIRNIIAYTNTLYLVTSRKVLVQTGAIRIDTRVVELDKIQEIYVTIDSIDKNFGMESIKTSTAAGWPECAYMPTFVALSNPYEIHKILQNAIKTRKS